MSPYLEYTLDDGNSILVEIAESGGLVPAANRGETPTRRVNFKEAFASVKSAIRELVHELDGLPVEAAEIKFGLKATAEAGIFAIGKTGGEINYEITLKWQKPKT